MSHEHTHVLSDHCGGHDHHFEPVRLGRRRFLELMGAGAGAAFLAACGDDASKSTREGTPKGKTTPEGLLEPVTWFGQSALQWKVGDLVVYVDPGSWVKGKSAPPASVILVTHAHGDHFSKDDLAEVSNERTTFVAPADVAEMIGGNVKAVKPGDSLEVAGLEIEAVPAYNHERPGGAPAHPKAMNWVGYVLTIGGARYYHAGDTDAVPELEALEVDAAFVPIGGAPFTMGVPEAGGLVQKLEPVVAVPMHYGFVTVPPGAFGNASPIVVGTPSDGPRFDSSAPSIDVRVLDPKTPFMNKA
jgi:L-ascorbate metabolism protein UlaG (beta-lactamase superfamily)